MSSLPLCIYNMSVYYVLIVLSRCNSNSLFLYCNSLGKYNVESFTIGTRTTRWVWSCSVSIPNVRRQWDITRPIISVVLGLPREFIHAKQTLVCLHVILKWSWNISQGEMVNSSNIYRGTTLINGRRIDCFLFWYVSNIFCS